ncbi:MAG: hypothetical protein JRI98_12480, partial [Deltaproteobacteria bacterium]|nr:hypothetical protein [Deltaproteobacteria bacterium]
MLGGPAQRFRHRHRHRAEIVQRLEEIVRWSTTIVGLPGGGLYHVIGKSPKRVPHELLLLAQAQIEFHRSSRAVTRALRRQSLGRLRRRLRRAFRTLIHELLGALFQSEPLDERRVR